MRGRGVVVVATLWLAGCLADDEARPMGPDPVVHAHSVPSDLARAVDLAPPPSPPLAWHLKACKNAPGCTENGVSKSCKALGVTSLRVTVTDERSRAKKTTRVACPANDSDGQATFDVPAGEGPWSITVTTRERPSARSEVVCHVTPRCWMRGFSVNVYALGCTDPECVACVEGNHAPGWCQ